jgi:hypothetical protein
MGTRMTRIWRIFTDKSACLRQRLQGILFYAHSAEGGIKIRLIRLIRVIRVPIKVAWA